MDFTNLDIKYPLKETDDKQLKELVYKNNPLEIILLDTSNSNMSITTMDAIHKSFGLSMFAYHFFIDKDGVIMAGRPERALAGNVPLLFQRMYNGTPTIADYDKNMISNIDLVGTDNSFTSNKLFICLEADTMYRPFTVGQRTSLVNLCRELMMNYNNIRNIYSFGELIPQYNNLGNFIDMNELRTEIKQEMPSQFVKLPSGNTAFTFGSRQLYYDGMNILEGNDIKTLQVYLSALGFPIDRYSGTYDILTQDAVLQFQKVYGLAPDGEFDKDDYDKILELIKNIDVKPHYGKYYRYLKYIPNNPLSNSTETVDPTENDLYLLQHKLSNLKYKIEFTNRYDEQTMEAVKAYQKDYNYPQTGEVGPILWSYIMNTETFSYSGLITLTNPPYKGNDILFIQNQIIKVKRRFNITITSQSGEYDQTTSNNVKKIQMMSGLPITGSIDEETFKLIDSF